TARPVRTGAAYIGAAQRSQGQPPERHETRDKTEYHPSLPSRVSCLVSSLSRLQRCRQYLGDLLLALLQVCPQLIVGNRHLEDGFEVRAQFAEVHPRQAAGVRRRAAA